MPQSSYPLDNVAAVLGQVVHRGRMSGRFTCAEAIPFGRVVELNSSGEWQLPQGSTLGKVLAVAPYNAAYPVGGYAAGDQVAFLRSGTVWVENDAGGSPTYTTGNMNVRHSTTIATHRGKVTLTATSASAGVEISVCPGTEFVQEDSTPTMALLNVEFSAALSGATGATGATGPTGPTGP